MSTKTNNKLAHHTFAPWKVDGDRRIVAGENEWLAPDGWGNVEDVMHALFEVAERARVLVGVDVFEGWEGPMMDAEGDRLYDDRRGGWSADPNDKYGYRLCVTMHDVRDRLFRTIDATPNLDWLLFTRTPENVAGMLPEFSTGGDRPAVDRMYAGLKVTRPNLFLGVDIDDQATADDRIPHLLRVPAKVRMLRYSGVGQVAFRKVPDLNKLPSVHHLEGRGRAGIDLLILSGEVGPDARPCNLEHVRDAIAQAKAAGVPVYVERLGSHVVGWYHERLRMCGEEAIGPNCLVRWCFRDPHGADPSEWPEDLRIREVPT